MGSVEPIPGEAAAVVEAGGQRALALSDYHAGFESWLRHEEGVNARSRAEERRETVLRLLDEIDADRLVVIGDLAHFFGGPHGAERGEIEVLFERLPVPATVVKGNHDGGIETTAGGGVTVTGAAGTTIGDVGFVHGHGWPSREVLASEVICMGHEHPCVRLEDSVGGRRVDRVWLRGPLQRGPFDRRYDDLDWHDPELVVFPRFNDLLSGTWVNDDPDFLAPFLPDGLPAADAYLLDGTRLGDYRSV
jgi:putative SbcD/Mre11-related phosphoesterase